MSLSYRLTLLCAISTSILIFWGALVTSLGAGMAVPDWPTTFGYNMFSYPLSGMVGPVFYEHTHRLIGSLVGFITIALALSLWWEGADRPLLRGLGLLAVGLVALQGILGGLRVVLSKSSLALVHGCTAPLFLALIASLWVLTHPQKEMLTRETPASLRWMSLGLAGLLYSQIVFGAFLRHWNQLLSFHLLGAGLLLILSVVFLSQFLEQGHFPPRIQWVVRALFIIIVLQLALGLGSYFFIASLLLKSLHVAMGSLSFAAGVAVVVLVHQGYRPGVSVFAGFASRGWNYVALTKPRLTWLVVVTVAAGYYLGSFMVFDWPRFIATLLGTFFASSGAIALNQYLERDLDKQMIRTSKRPLPTGKVSPIAAALFGAFLAGGGLFYLWYAVNGLSALVTFSIVVFYLFLYTPLKRTTSLSLLFGCIPGALPPVVGWVAARGEIELGAWILFAIQFLWQVPHSLSIARLYQEDYARAGLPLLPVVEKHGGVERQILLNCLALIPVSLLPSMIGLTGSSYFFGALGLGCFLFSYSLYFARSGAELGARKLLWSSLIYFPSLLTLMVLDKL